MTSLYIVYIYIPGNPVGRDIFIPEIMTQVGLCDTEAEAVFILFAGVGDSDPENIENVDMETLFEVFELITGQSKIYYKCHLRLIF